MAEQIFRNLPIEDIPIEERYILDGTCGSGNLLLAGYDRISGLLPSKWGAEKRHSYLLNRLGGVDKDDFACEVARLSLLLYDLPLGGSWRIIPRDVFRINPVKLFGHRPRIIVGNPPFEEIRQKERTQRAAEILNLYLEWLAPGGLLGVVLPLTYLHNASAKEARSKLLKTCDVLEIWHLPEKAIPTSSAAVAIVLARKHLETYTQSKFSGLTRIVDKNKSANVLTSYTVSQNRWASEPQKRMASSFLSSTLRNKLINLPVIQPDFCEVYNGVQVGKENRETHLNAQNQGVGWRRVLNHNPRGCVLQPFVIRWDIKHEYIKYPSDALHRQRNPEHFKTPVKVIINSIRNGNSPWRFYAAVDRNKLVVTENFHYLLPNKATAEEIAAVFNSALLNAWYAGENYHRKIIVESLQSMPFPVFTGPQRTLLLQLVAQAENNAVTKNVKTLRTLLEQIDEVVFDAYGLNANERISVRSWMNKFPRPGLEQDITFSPEKPAKIQERVWKVLGDVKNVDGDNETITLRIEGRGDYQTIPIPRMMPGWALRPGSAFEAEIPWEQRQETNARKLNWKNFIALEYGYLSEEELLEKIRGLQVEK